MKETNLILYISQKKYTHMHVRFQDKYKPVPSRSLFDARSMLLLTKSFSGKSEDLKVSSLDNNFDFSSLCVLKAELLE